MPQYPQIYYDNRHRLAEIYELAKACDLDHLTDDLWGGMFSQAERAVLIEVMLNGPMTTTQVVYEIGDYVRSIPAIISNLTLGGFLKRDRTVWPWRYTFKAIAAPAPPKFEDYSEIKRVCPKCDVVLIVKFGRFYCAKCMEVVEELQVKEVSWK